MICRDLSADYQLDEDAFDEDESPDLPPAAKRRRSSSVPRFSAPAGRLPAPAADGLRSGGGGGAVRTSRLVAPIHQQQQQQQQQQEQHAQQVQQVQPQAPGSLGAAVAAASAGPPSRPSSASGRLSSGGAAAAPAPIPMPAPPQPPAGAAGGSGAGSAPRVRGPMRGRGAVHANPAALTAHHAGTTPGTGGTAAAAAAAGAGGAAGARSPTVVRLRIGGAGASPTQQQQP